MKNQHTMQSLWNSWRLSIVLCTLFLVFIYFLSCIDHNQKPHQEIPLNESIESSPPDTEPMSTQFRPHEKALDHEVERIDLLPTDASILPNNCYPRIGKDYPLYDAFLCRCDDSRCPSNQRCFYVYPHAEKKICVKKQANSVTRLVNVILLGVFKAYAKKQALENGVKLIQIVKKENVWMAVHRGRENHVRVNKIPNVPPLFVTTKLASLSKNVNKNNMIFAKKNHTVTKFPLVPVTVADAVPAKMCHVPSLLALPYLFGFQGNKQSDGVLDVFEVDRNPGRNSPQWPHGFRFSCRST